MQTLEVEIYTELAFEDMLKPFPKIDFITIGITRKAREFKTWIARQLRSKDLNFMFDSRPEPWAQLGRQLRAFQASNDFSCPQ